MGQNCNDHQVYNLMDWTKMQMGMLLIKSSLLTMIIFSRIYGKYISFLFGRLYHDWCKSQHVEFLSETGDIQMLDKRSLSPWRQSRKGDMQFCSNLYMLVLLLASKLVFCCTDFVLYMLFCSFCSHLFKAYFVFLVTFFISKLTESLVICIHKSKSLFIHIQF